MSAEKKTTEEFLAATQKLNEKEGQMLLDQIFSFNETAIYYICMP